MIERKAFNNSIFESYIKKIRSENNLLKRDSYTEALISWLDWLLESDKISSRFYNQLLDKVTSVNKNIHPTEMKNSNPKLHINFRYILLFILLIPLIVFNIYLYLSFRNMKSTFETNQSIGRVLPFKGTIKETDGNPLDTKRDAIFNIYQTAEGGNPIYTGSCLGENGLEPIHNGSFSILVGSDCGMKPIPEEIFQNNSSIYLGIKIGKEPEFSPRYQIFTSTFSKDTTQLQGLSPGSELSSIPFINSEGNIDLTYDSPIIKSTNGIFTLEGKSLTFRSTEEGSNIVFDPAVSGNVIIGSGKFGIGSFNPTTTFEVKGSSLLGSIATISNTNSEDSLESSVLKLSMGVSPDGSNADFIEFIAGANDSQLGQKIGSIGINSGSVVYETSAADFAEYFEVDDENEFKVGHIVSLSEKGIHPSKRTEDIIGVVSDSAGFIGNNKYTYSKSVLLGLVGQLDVLISNINGEITKGDKIGSSIIQGYGAKVTDEDIKVGLSLENSIDNQMSNNQCPEEYKNVYSNSGELIRCGKIKVIINLD